MIALAELKKLPVEERLQLVEELWDSIAEERAALPEPPEVVEELRKRSSYLKANPSSGVTWEELESRIQARRG